MLYRNLRGGERW